MPLPSEKKLQYLGETSGLTFNQYRELLLKGNIEAESTTISVQHMFDSRELLMLKINNKGEWYFSNMPEDLGTEWAYYSRSIRSGFSEAQSKLSWRATPAVAMIDFGESMTERGGMKFIQDRWAFFSSVLRSPYGNAEVKFGGIVYTDDNRSLASMKVSQLR